MLHRSKHVLNLYSPIAFESKKWLIIIFGYTNPHSNFIDTTTQCHFMQQTHHAFSE